MILFFFLRLRESSALLADEQAAIKQFSAAAHL
jgi:hypothetical protein